MHRRAATNHTVIILGYQPAYGKAGVSTDTTVMSLRKFIRSHLTEHHGTNMVKRLTPSSEKSPPLWKNAELRQ